MQGEWDIGGTFTDIVAVRSGSDEARITKVPSRPDAPVRAMLEALAAIGEVRRFVHGTTRVTNALVGQELYRLDVPPKAPPLVVEEAEAEQLLDILGSSLDLADRAHDTAKQDAS
jgi:N-methylhydantoinase A